MIMKRILILFVLITMHNVTACAINNRRIKIIQDSCFYMNTCRKTNNSDKVERVSDLYIYKFVVKDTNNVIVKETYPIFCEQRKSDFGLDGGFHYDIFGQNINHSNMLTLYIHMDNQMKFRFLYRPLEFWPCASNKKIAVITYWFNRYGAVDTSGQIVLKPIYHTAFLNKDHEVVGINLIKVLHRKEERKIVKLDIVHNEYMRTISNDCILKLPVKCIPYLMSHDNLSQFYNDKDEVSASKFIIQEEPNTIFGKELATMHRGVYNVAIGNFVKAIDLFSKTERSNNRLMKVVSRYNIKKLKKIKTIMEDNAVNSDDENSKNDFILSDKILPQFCGIMSVSDDMRFVEANRKIVAYSKLGKKVNILDRKGNIVKSTLPVFDDIQIDKSSIFCTQIIPIYEGYSIQLRLVFDKNLNLKDASAVE